MAKQKNKSNQGPKNPYPKGTINGPEPRTERGKRRRQRIQEDKNDYKPSAYRE